MSLVDDIDARRARGVPVCMRPDVGQRGAPRVRRVCSLGWVHGGAVPWWVARVGVLARVAQDQPSLARLTLARPSPSHPAQPSLSPL